MIARQLDMHEDYSDALIMDFSAPLFQAAFKQYFAEMKINVEDWEGLFQEMNGGNENEKNAAYVRTAASGDVIGFILFISIQFTSWFFEAPCGFIREFWVADGYRNKGHGSELIALAEQYFRKHGIYASILTTDTAERFYERRGYVKVSECKAKNCDEVFVKRLS